MILLSVQIDVNAERAFQHYLPVSVPPPPRSDVNACEPCDGANSVTLYYPFCVPPQREVTNATIWITTVPLTGRTKET